MGIVPQYGLLVYHIAPALSMNNFHNSEARASFFYAYFAERPAAPSGAAGLKTGYLHGETGDDVLQETIHEAIAFIKGIFQNDFSGHDFYHSMRVYQLALKIARIEKADPDVVALAALLHDVDDRKISPQTTEEKKRAVEFMRSRNVPESMICRVCEIIDEVSFKGTDSVTPSTTEGKCVQDADRLDALGAIGIARTFAYGGSHNRPIYDPEMPPQPAMNQETYRSSQSSSLNHFHEKLFLLEDMMNTEAGRKIARTRTRYMKAFVNRFLAEWNGADDQANIG